MNDMATFFNHDLVMAHKDHKCCECRGTIKKGEQYHRNFGIWDGEAETFKVCLDCELLRNDIDKDVKYADEWTYFTGLCEAVQGVNDPEFTKRFINIKTMRGALVPEWLTNNSNE